MTYTLGSTYSGFTLKQVQQLDEIKAEVFLFEHDVIGCPLLAIKNHDSNKTFSASFNTIPTDSKGVAHILEHSIEAMIPFLQYFRPGIRITPIMVTAMSPDELARISRELSRHIATWMRKEGLRPGKDLVFLISADGNHYGKDFSNTPYGENLSAHSRAEEAERDMIRDCLEGPLEESRLSHLQHSLDPEKAPPAPLWCGRYSIPFGLSTVLYLVREMEPGTVISGRLLAHSDTWREGVLPLRATSLGTTAPFSLKHWVSFFSMAFFSTSGR